MNKQLKQERRLADIQEGRFPKKIGTRIIVQTKDMKLNVKKTNNMALNKNTNLKEIASRKENKLQNE